MSKAIQQLESFIENWTETQEQNKKAAFNRLLDILLQASAPPQIRKKTRPSFSARQRRLDKKNIRSKTKQLRQKITIR